jgi:hypothetical protein
MGDLMMTDLCDVPVHLAIAAGMFDILTLQCAVDFAGKLPLVGQCDAMIDATRGCSIDRCPCHC